MSDRPTSSDAPAAAPAVDAARHFRRTLGNYPTGVAIITASVDDRPIGMVVGSFTSVSLDPPLVAFFADDGSETYPELIRAGSFCVNVLSTEQELLSRQFVKRGTDRFADVAWRPAPSGSPILEGALAWIDCDVDSVIQLGDHKMVVGLVGELAAEDPAPEDPALPLIFHRGGYGDFNPRALVAAPERDLLDALKLVDVSRGVLDRLTAELGLECTVIAAIGDNSVVLARICADAGERVGSPVGYRVPLAAPIGPALMAWASEDELTAWLSRSPIAATPGAREPLLAVLARLREDGWTWFTRDTDFTRVQALLDRGASERLPKDAVRGAIKEVVGQPGFNFLPIPVQEGGLYEVYSFVAPVVLPDRDTVIALSLLGGSEPYSAEQIARIGERLRSAAHAVGELGSLAAV